jgi:formylmethanofuran dehydrogenase subunit C
MKVPNTKENAAKCNCGVCPTYIKGDTGFFCSVGKSSKSLTKQGCVCGDCKNFTEFKLKDGYFCISGAAQ